MSLKIFIEADTNDADYITSEHDITPEQVEEIREVVMAIADFKPYVGTKPDYWSSEHDSNYPINEACRDDLGEKSAEELYGHIPGFKLFDEWCPNDEYGIHTITSVRIVDLKVIETLL